MRPTFLHSLDGVKHVHLAVGSHLLTQDDAGTVQAALTGAVHTVNENGSLGESALSLPVADGVEQQEKAFPRPRHLVVHLPRLETELPDVARPGGRIERARQLGRPDGHVVGFDAVDKLNEERLAVAYRCPARPILGARVLLEVAAVHQHNGRYLVVVHELPEVGDSAGEGRVSDNEPITAAVRVNVQCVDVVRPPGAARCLQDRAVSVACHDRTEAVLLAVDARQRRDGLRGADGRHELLQDLELFPETRLVAGRVSATQLAVVDLQVGADHVVGRDEGLEQDVVDEEILLQRPHHHHPVPAQATTNVTLMGMYIPAVIGYWRISKVHHSCHNNVSDTN